MNYSQIAILLLQSSLVSFVILLLFRLRKKLGLGTLFACLGLFQFVQVFLASTVYVSITDTLIVSPGSAVLFPATLFALLIIYIKEDASEAKKIIYALVMVNIVMTILLQTFSWNLKDSSTQNPFNVSTALFNTSAWVLLIGTIALFLDALLIIILFEYISKKIKFLFLQICLTMLFVVCFDSVFFSVLAFWNSDNLISILTSGIISKGFFALFYSVIFYSYLKYFDFKEDSLNVIFKIKDVFQPLTYKQKFENVKKEREKELLILNKEKEQRIEELVLSKQKIQDALELVKENEYSLSQAGRMAKIGYWSYNKLTNTFFWSNPIHEIYGTDPKKGVPNREKIFNSIHKKSIIKLKNATELLESQGVFYDLELQVTNLKNEELWIRNIGELIYNDENEIIGRRGVLQDITDTKKAQLAFELSKKEIQTSLELLEKRKFSMDEASKTAKIAYHEYDIATDTFIWSEYLYHIFGLDLEKPVPPRKEILALFDDESQKKMKKATKDLDLKGIPYDLELKISNLKNEVFWVRNVAQPVYNQQNEIVGRKGVTQDITAAKKAQLEIQRTLALLEKREHSMSEASKIAKIGFIEDDIATETYKWSEYTYYIFGFDPKKPVPSRKDIAVLFDEESQNKMAEATFNLDTKGVPFDLELRMINLRKEEIWIRIAVDPVYNNQKEIVARRGVMQDITVSKNAQLALELSNQKIQSTFELLEKSEHSKNEASKMAKIGYVEDDFLTNTRKWSESIYHIFGFDIKAGVPPGEKVAALLDEESQLKLSKAISKLDSEGIDCDIELKINNLRNEEVWVRMAFQPVFNSQNKIVARRGVVQDITDAKKAQLAIELSKQEIQTTLELLEKSEQSYKDVVETTSDLITVVDDKGNFNFVNHASTKFFGMTPIECEGKSAFDFVHPDDVEDTKKTFEEWRNSNNTIFSYENRQISTAGIILNVSWKMHVERKNNEVVKITSIGRDVTEQKLKQEELELSKQNIETALELVKESEYSLKEAGRLAKIGYWSYDKQTDTIFWSKAVHEIYGNNPKDGVPELDVILTCFSEESVKKLIESTVLLATKGISFEIELEMTNLKNEKRWILNMGEPIFNDKKEVIGRRGVSQDITQRKLIQNELDAQNEKLYVLNKALNEAQKLSHVGSWQWNMTTDTAEWSDEMYNIYGVTKDNFYPSNENVMKTILPEDISKLEQGVNSLLVDKLFIPFEFRIKRPSGEIRYLYIAALKQNSKEGVFGVTKDITEQKIIEESNLIIRKRYQKLFNNASVSIFNEDLSLVFDKMDELRKQGVLNIANYIEQHPEVLFSFLEKLIVNKVNKATLKLFKAKNEKNFLVNIHQTFGTGADRVFGKLIEAIWNKEKSFTSEVNYKTLEGDEFAAIISVPIPQTKVERKTVPVSIQSIQSIKEAELAKKESINRLNEAQKLAKIGSWLFTPSTQEIIWSDETFRIWGFNSNKAAPKFMPLLNLVHKNDRNLFIRSFTNVTNRGTAYDIEFRICLPNHKEKWIRSICKPIFDDEGKVVSLKGVNQDITAQKTAKEKIEKADEMYRLLTDNSNDLICLQEPDSTFKYISPSVKTLLGYEPSDFLGKKVFSIIHREDINLLRSVIEKRTLSRNYSEAISFRIRHKDGHFVWLEFLSSPVYKGKEISYFVTTSRDITLWVSAKQEIQEYQTSLQKLTTEITLIEEKQKKEIASNIHDHLSQSLVISKMKINELKKNPQLEVITEDLKFIETHISEALVNSRKITYELSPPVLYQLGIVEALNWLLEEVEANHKIAYCFNSNVNNIKLTDVKSILLYRSIQEIIKNTIKYANASLITLNFDEISDGIQILIADDGVGFDTSILKNIHTHRGKGFGLFTVQERIINIKGKFTIESEINKGTSVKIFIPLAT